MGGGGTENTALVNGRTEFQDICSVRFVRYSPYDVHRFRVFSFELHDIIY